MRLLAVLVGVLVLGAGLPAEAETPYAQLTVRDVRTCDEALRALDGRSIVRKADAILVVLDVPTFDAPPGYHEFSSYRPDVTRWLDALSAWAERRAGRSASASRDSGVASPGSSPIHAATTFSRRPVRVGDPGWRDRLEAELRVAWWHEDSFSSFPPATAWMARLLGGLSGRRRMLALVTGEILPERMADRSRGVDPGREPWRRKLRREGGYWDEEAIGRRLLQAHVVLDVVAPEARFCDFWPLQELPELPWVARPMIDIHPRASETYRFARERIDALDVTPENRKRLEDSLPAHRFHSELPVLPLQGSYLFFNTDCPSGFGYWPYVRAAAITGGSYVFYPFPPVRFLDLCPYDPVLLRQLAPETSSLANIVRSKADDAALAALLAATKIVLSSTDWEDGPPRAAGWSGYLAVAPLAFDRQFRERDKPRHGRLAPPASWPMAVVQRGRKLEAVVPVYDRAIALLVEAERRIEAGEIPRPHRRSMANLRLGRFWFEMSAFHLEALSLYCREFHTHLEAMKRKHGPSIDVTDCGVKFKETIRMSDCLEGYEGVSISVERDRELQLVRDEWLEATWRPGIARPEQSNILHLRKNEPEYRALRHPGEVLRHVDPRLRKRAIRLIDAGRHVMEHEGRSPWGWMVYYAEAHTCVLPGAPGAPDPPADPPVTPPRREREREPRPTPTPPSGTTTGGR